MELIPLLPWIYGALLVIVHYWGEEIAGHRHAPKLTDLSAGVTVSYVFLELLPRFQAGIEQFGNPAFLSLLAGFSLPHLAESFIVQHAKSREDFRREFKEVHTLLIFTYYAFIGVLIHFLLQESVVVGTLLFLPVLLHTAISSLSVAELHRDVMDRPLVQGAVMLSVLFGVGAASVARVHASTVHLLLGLVTGLFLYVVISDAITQKSRGDVRTFLLGLAGYGAIITYLWQFI